MGFGRGGLETNHGALKNAQAQGTGLNPAAIKERLIADTDAEDDRCESNCALLLKFLPLQGVQTVKAPTPGSTTP